ncbi:hypothetical protein SNOG_03821 [Parastagonospora nodorum SN15]|uniref:Uncharacterized protein n=1 Tax=Phaeosphaeria nodorum (strain SN15 / ATCC MYA-4574 / FGSC 10173) TaxID=321614 RepID=Q0UWP3_PHANO|nr:hypothetical protein SNOG_03821 [Parastagonospora nodorum SN15]EAT89026.2 hypothetical protein SNOG_03821 [Parastagonospora nodorum SN15]
MADSTKACEERFLQVREASLRQWFSETRSNDLNTRLTAQDRLHVLLIIRKHRGKLAKLEEQKTRTNGYGAQTATERWAQILRGEKTFTGADVEQWAGRWKTKMTLQKLLMNEQRTTHQRTFIARHSWDPQSQIPHKIVSTAFEMTNSERANDYNSQRNIRTYRIYLGDCKERCNTCKRNNDKAGATTAQQDIYRVNGEDPVYLPKHERGTRIVQKAKCYAAEAVGGRHAD